MNTQNNINSKRKYGVLISENGESVKERITINRLMNPTENDYEWVYAALDIIDEILDLKNGECLYFQPNRDNKLSKGIITRND